MEIYISEENSDKNRKNCRKYKNYLLNNHTPYKTPKNTIHDRYWIFEKNSEFYVFIVGWSFYNVTRTYNYHDGDNSRLIDSHLIVIKDNDLANYILNIKKEWEKEKPLEKID